MPTAAFHSHYWQIQTVPPPIQPGSSVGGGYVPWQIVIAGCLFLLVSV